MRQRHAFILISLLLLALYCEGASAEERIFFIGTRDGKSCICSVTPEGKNLRQVTSADDEQIFDLAISPDRKWIVYTAEVSLSRQVFLVSIDGKGRHPLTAGDGVLGQATFSANGKQVLYVRQDDLDVHEYIYSVDIASEREKKLLAGWEPAVSADGRWLVVCTEPPVKIQPCCDLIRVDLQSNATDFLGVSSYTNRTNEEACLMPDNTHVIFRYYTRLPMLDGEGNCGLVVQKLNAYSHTNITNNEHDHSPSCSPDGTHIAFERAGLLDDEPMLYTIALTGKGEQALTRGRHPIWVRLP